MTDAEIVAARELLITEELAGDAVLSVSVDGMSVNMDRDALKRRLDLLDSLALRNNDQPHFGLRFSKLQPPGGGG